MSQFYQENTGLLLPKQNKLDQVKIEIEITEYQFLFKRLFWYISAFNITCDLNFELE